MRGESDSSLVTLATPLRGTMKIDADGQLHIGGCRIDALAETHGTPLFVYDEALLRDTIRAYHDAFRTLGQPYQLSYASKAFCTLAMCQLVYEEGCVIDVVSGGELHTALQAGVPASAIHLHGNNKSVEELEYAVAVGIGSIIVDNFAELDLLGHIAAAANARVDVLIRVSPGVSAHTHEFISTGQQDSKFGFDLASGQAFQALRQLAEQSQLHCVGLHAHIGSQIFDAGGYALTIERLAGLYEAGLRLGLPLQMLNIGGGFGIRYTEDDVVEPVPDQIRHIVEAVRQTFGAHALPLPVIWIEPGRSIAGPAGTTVYRVGSQKHIPGVRDYVAVDGGMTDNPRLALYGARYEAILANRANDKPDGTFAVAGKCCESGDMVLWDAPLPTPRTGDLLAVFATGAYNYSMASNYNRIARPAVVFVKDGKARLVVQRETWADLLRLDVPLR